MIGLKIYRTLLFIPAIKYKWIQDLTKYEVDAIILDLEDSVPHTEKRTARNYIEELFAHFNGVDHADIFIRINKVEDEYDMEDLYISVQNGIEGIVLPKVELPEEIEGLSKTIASIEKKKGLPIGKTKILPILETANSLYFCYEIANCNRVIGITGLSSKNGDVERALSTQWTEKGLETLYIKSKVVLAARAANVMPIGGLWQDVHDLGGLRKSAQFNRQLGFDGELIIHPSNASIVNEVYSPSEEQIAYYEGLLEKFESAQKKGEGSIMYKGSHIDIAHVQTAKEKLKFSKQINRKV